MAWGWLGETLVHTFDSVICNFLNLHGNTYSVDLAEVLKKTVGHLTVSVSRHFCVMLG